MACLWRPIITDSSFWQFLVAMGDDDDSNENRSTCNGVNKQFLSMAIVAAGHSCYHGTSSM